jgi:hypothetical protein
MGLDYSLDEAEMTPKVILNTTCITNAVVKLKVNWEHKRVRHAIERMWLRGVSVKEVEEAIAKGKKAIQRETGLVQSMFKRYLVVYDERIYRTSNMRKVFPVTVKVL